MPPKVQRATRSNLRGPSSRPVLQEMTGTFGLSTNFPDLVELDLDKIRPNPDQPRTRIDPDGIRSLAASIEKYGLQQPILVRPADADEYTLIAGQRRLEAHRLLGRVTIFAIISTGSAEEIALIENVQREDLDAVDLARSLERLAERHGYTQEAIGALIGCDRAEVARILAILRLPHEVLEEYRPRARDISRTTLAELAQVADPELQGTLWEQAKQGLTVKELREIKRIAKAPDAGSGGHVLREVGKSLLRIGKDLEKLRQHTRALGREHRDRLRELREEIDRVLAEE
ncbi:MAG TPA: ParB/RepB/Spo0J family partition protein [Azospirillaceae bacterium]|nr:ParB/RepB/Spo0J family partition protein [Azospirillaceae bacterium]